MVKIGVTSNEIITYLNLNLKLSVHINNLYKKPFSFFFFLYNFLLPTLIKKILYTVLYIGAL